MNDIQNTHTIIAPITKILPIEEVGTKGFTKRKFYLNVTTNPDYPSGCELEMQKDNCFLLDQFKEGDIVTVTFSLEGRSWTNPEGKKYFFQTARAWKIAHAGQQPTTAPVPVIEDAQVITEDDLPF